MSDLTETVKRSTEEKRVPVDTKKKTAIKDMVKGNYDTFKVTTRNWEKSQEQIRKLEETLHAKVIALHFNSSLESADVDFIHRLIAPAGHQQRIAVWLNGPGGSGIAASRIIFMLRQYCDELIFVIPSQAASACTMMALGGNKILMGPTSALSPIDTSIAYHPLAPKDKDGFPVSVEITEIQKFIELCNSMLSESKNNNVNDSPYGLLAQYVHPVFIGAIQRAVSVSKLLTTDILKTHMEDVKRVEKIVNQLNDTFPTHGYPIVLQKAQDLGIQAEGMDSDTQDTAIQLLEAMQKITTSKSDEDDSKKVTYNVQAVFESRDFRIAYSQEKTFAMIDGKWEDRATKSDYYSYRSSEANGKLHIEEID